MAPSTHKVITWNVMTVVTKFMTCTFHGVLSRHTKPTTDKGTGVKSWKTSVYVATTAGRATTEKTPLHPGGKESKRDVKILLKAVVE